MQREIQDHVEIERRLSEKIHDLERQNDNHQLTIRELRETVTINDRDHQIKQNAMDSENQRLKLQHKEDLKDQQLISDRETQRLKETYLSNEQTLKEQISKLENIRTSLERVNFIKRE